MATVSVGGSGSRQRKEIALTYTLLAKKAILMFKFGGSLSVYTVLFTVSHLIERNFTYIT